MRIVCSRFGAHVDDRGKVAFPERAGELRDVRRPLLVRAVGLEVPRDRVLRDVPDLAETGFVLPLPRYRGKARLGHQAPDLLVVGDVPLLPELGDDHPEAVPSLVGREYFPDSGHDVDVLGIEVPYPDLEVARRSGDSRRLQDPRELPAGVLGQELPYGFRLFALASAATDESESPERTL